MINLTLLTAQHYRAIRRKLQGEGVEDPMMLPSLHALLDATEAICLESFISSKPEKDKADRERFLDSLYRPELQAVALADDGYKPIPAGFEDGGDDGWDWSGSAGGAE